MFGDLLRSDECNPEFLFLKCAVTNELENRNSRHRSNLFNILCGDDLLLLIKKAGFLTKIKLII